MKLNALNYKLHVRVIVVMPIHPCLISSNAQAITTQKQGAKKLMIIVCPVHITTAIMRHHWEPQKYAISNALLIVVTEPWYGHTVR